MAKYKLNKKKQIEKSDFSQTYNVDDFINAVQSTEKKLVELESQKKVYDAKCENVSSYHPHVLKLKEEERNAVWMYHENFIGSQYCDKMIKDYKKALKNIKDEMKDITKQTGVSF